ncbi:histidine kinase N-terminal domain-containing protein, partial [Veillonella magna]
MSTEFKDKVVELCKQFTSLTDDEIEELLKVISYWETEAVAPDADVFVDVFNEIKKNALVVYHRTPLSKPSMYDHAVVGLDALMENEPGVLRTMQLGINSIGLIALSQEGKLIRQSIYPIKYGAKVIGTLIIETDGSIPSDENETSIEAIIDTNY